MTRTIIGAHRIAIQNPPTRGAWPTAAVRASRWSTPMATRSSGACTPTRRCACTAINARPRCCLRRSRRRRLADARRADGSRGVSGRRNRV